MRHESVSEMSHGSFMSLPSWPPPQPISPWRRMPIYTAQGSMGRNHGPYQRGDSEEDGVFEEIWKGKGI